MKQLKETVTPIQALPPEVLSVIFIFSSPLLLVLPPNASEFPWALSVVCRLWNTVVLSTPELWSNLRTSLSGLTDENHTSVLLERVKRCVDRAGSMPLWLENRHHKGTILRYGKTPFAVQFTDQLVIPLAERLRTLYLESDMDTVWSFLSLPPGSTPLIEDLQLRVYNGDMGTSFELWKDRPLSIAAASKLRSFKLESSALRVDPRRLRLPLHQLTSLHLPKTYTEVSHCHEILKGCVNVTHCTLAITPSVEQPASLNYITLAKLTNLDLYYRDTPEYEDFLGLIITPRLQDLTLSSSYLAVWEPIAYCQLFHRSPFSLRRLVLWMGSESTRTIPALMLTPSITEISLGYCAPSDTFLQAMMAGKLLPRLEVLTGFFPSDVYDVVLDAIETRQHVAKGSNGKISALTQVIGISPRNCTPQQHVQLLRLISSGMAFRAR